MSEIMRDESKEPAVETQEGSRRGFLKASAAMFGIAALEMSGCSKKPQGNAPKEMQFSTATDYEGLKGSYKELEQQANEARINIKVLAMRSASKSELDSDDLTRQPQIDVAREKVNAHNARVTALMSQTTDNAERKRIHKELWIDIDVPKK